MSNSKCPQVSRTLLSFLADFENTEVCTASVLLISNVSCLGLTKKQLILNTVFALHIVINAPIFACWESYIYIWKPTKINITLNKKKSNQTSKTVILSMLFVERVIDILNFNGMST